MLEPLIFFLAFAGLMAWLLKRRLASRNIAFEPADPRHNDRDWNPVAFWSLNLPIIGAMLLGIGGALLCLTDMTGVTSFFAGIEAEGVPQ